MAQVYQAMFFGSLFSMLGSKKMSNLMAQVNQKDLIFIKELVESGKVTPVIDKYCPLSKVADALRYYGKGHSRGKVVITVEHNSK